MPLHVSLLCFLLFVQQCIMTVYLLYVRPLFSFPKDSELFFFDFLLLFIFLFLNFNCPILVHLFYFHDFVRPLSRITNFLKNFGLLTFQHVYPIIKKRGIKVSYSGLHFQM